MNDVTSGMTVRSVSDEWTFAEYSDRLFSIGGSLFGSKGEMFKLAVSAACIDVIWQDVSKTPICLKRRTDRGSELIKPSEHPAAALLNAGPNEFTNPVEFLKQVAMNLAIDSEYFIAGRRNNKGDLLEFCGIQKDNVSDPVVNDIARKVYYDVRPSTLYQQAVFGWASGRLSSREIAHIKRRSMNGVDVYSTARISKEALKLLSSLQSDRLDHFGNSGLPQMALAFPDGLTDEQFGRLKEGIRKSFNNAKKDRTPVILEGSDGTLPELSPLSASAADAEYIKNNTAAAMDICRFYRVPPHKVFLLESVKYDNMEPAERVYVDDTLCSYYIDIEWGLNEALLTSKERQEFFFEFDREAAYATNPEVRQKVLESRWKNGMITKNEMRRSIGHNELGSDGEVYMMSGNFIVVDEDNEILIRAGGNRPDDQQGDENKEDKKTDAKQ